MITVRTLGASEIVVGDRCLGPSSGRSFALLLHLAFEGDRAIPRAVLRDLFFPNANERQSSHSMRQLLYQARQLGAPLVVDSDSVTLASGEVTQDLSEVQRSSELSNGMIQAVAKGFLPGYAPSFSEPFNAWLDALRRQVHIDVLQRLLASLERARAAGDWQRLSRIARACLAYDPLHHEATLALAHALAMVGSSTDALSLLDHYRAELDEDLPELRKPATVLRRRIAESSVGHRIGDAPFVGRDAEMGQLRRLLSDTREGQARLVLLQGEPGVGKTRLAAELAKLARLEGSAVCRVVAHPRDTARPYSVFGEVIAALQLLPGALGCTPESLALLRRFGARPRSDSEIRPEELDHERLGAALTRSVLDLVSAVTSEQHLVLLVEDGQHLDEPSRELSLDLTRGETVAGLLVLITTRERSFLSRAARVADNLAPMRVQPLDAGASRCLLRALAPGISEKDQARVEWWVRCSGGNPLFLTVLARHYEAHEPNGELPPSLTELIGRRLDQLTRYMLGLLQTVKVLGRHATVDRIRLVVDMPASELLSTFQGLEESGFLTCDSAVVRISHDALADVVISRTPAATLRLLHLYCARVLEAELGEASNADLLWDCSDHWRLAGEPVRAVSLLQSCGNQALSLGQPQFAAEILHRAAETETLSEKRIALLRQTLRAAVIARDDHLTLATVRELRRSLPSATPDPQDDALELSEIAAISGLGGEIGQFLERLRYWISEDSASVQHRFDAARRLVWAAEQCFRPDLAAEAARAVESLRPANEREHVAHAFFHLHYAVKFGDLDRVVQLAAELQERDAGGTYRLTHRPFMAEVAFALHYAGRVMEADDLMLKTLGEARRLGYRTEVQWCACALAEWRIDEGDTGTARNWLDLADDIRLQLPHESFTTGRVASWIRLALLEQRPNDAEMLLEDAFHRFPALAHPYIRAGASAYRVQISRLRGEAISLSELAVLQDAYERASSSLLFDEISRWFVASAHGR